MTYKAVITIDVDADTTEQAFRILAEYAKRIEAVHKHLRSSVCSTRNVCGAVVTAELTKS